SVVLELALEFGALFGIGASRVGADLVTLFAQHPGDVLSGGDGERVDDARSGEIGQVGAQPRDPGTRIEAGQDAEAQGVAGEFAADDGGVVTELFGDVGDHARIGRGGGRQHRGVRGQFGQDVTDASVVGAEVVPPVGDAV